MKCRIRNIKENFVAHIFFYISLCIISINIQIKSIHNSLGFHSIILYPSSDIHTVGEIVSFDCLEASSMELSTRKVVMCLSLHFRGPSAFHIFQI